MKNIVLAFFALLACYSCMNSAQVAEKEQRERFVRDSIERATFIQDSIERVEFVRDSIAKVEYNKSVITRCESKFSKITDEFSDIVWVRPKSAPKYRTSNAVYCYFGLTNGNANIFRFVFQYYSEDWLFIKNMIFNIDGDNITIIPDMETDCGYGGMIWEWCDEYVGSIGNVSGEFIEKLANAESVKVRMNGSQYYDTRTLTSTQINSIKDAYEYYLALGGEF